MSLKIPKEEGIIAVLGGWFPCWFITLPEILPGGSYSGLPFFCIKLFLFQTLSLTNSSFSCRLRLFKCFMPLYYACLSQVCTMVFLGHSCTVTHHGANIPEARLNELAPNLGFVLWLFNRERDKDHLFWLTLLCVCWIWYKGVVVCRQGL